MSDGLVVLVEFRLKPGSAAAFEPLIAANAHASVTDEPGCRRFDIATTPEDPERIVLYEIYDDRAAFDYHVTTPHYLTFKEGSGPLIASSTVHLLDLKENAKPAGGAAR
ncbi:MAG TPA: putative quinol monooxygenase [Geminicoccus sp.]|jgi:quinol monooxygenase YgiN|uniref:putative quinol monooxygenase n=1 Tax=Geminicoccus sp. TaxID=2024832 RepID=UPI002E31358C|nr:putative quinol monooxygenase [Geminicoccus sp.]HEX2528315.1 putative quinol monooxygenase [Geminicoccus sp.]